MAGVTRFGDRSESQLVHDAVAQTISTLREAMSRSFGGQPCTAHVVVCDDDRFDELVPPDLADQRIANMDPDPHEADPNLELLGVATTWVFDVAVRELTPNEPVVLLSSGRILRMADALSITLGALADVVTCHEFAHHMSGHLDDHAPAYAEIFRDEHLAQQAAWNAITLMPAPGPAERMSAMRLLARRQPRCYRAFEDLPAVHVTDLERGRHGIQWVVRTRDHRGLELAHSATFEVDEPVPAVSDVVWVANELTHDHLNTWRRFTEAPQGSAEQLRWYRAVEALTKLGDGDEPAVGTHDVIGPYEVLDVRDKSLVLRSFGPVRRIEWSFGDERPPLSHMTEPPVELLRRYEEAI